MYDIAMLVFAGLAALASCIAALPALGLNPSITRKSSVLLTDWDSSPTGRTWVPIGVAMLSICLSAGAFYYFFRPRVRDRLVEKPVERVVEKLVQQDCSKAPVGSKKQVADRKAITFPPGAKIVATTNAPDSAAVGVNTGTVTVNPPVNPNAGTVTYDCEGNQKWTGQAPGTALALRASLGAEAEGLRRMIELNNSKQYGELLALCNEKIKSAPEWMTSYLFCGLGYVGTANNDKAREMLSQYDKNKGPAYEEDRICGQASDFLHRVLQ